jgi:hypothetical protein
MVVGMLRTHQIWTWQAVTNLRIEVPGAAGPHHWCQDSRGCPGPEAGDGLRPLRWCAVGGCQATVPFDPSLVVSASAGSGRTFTLTVPVTARILKHALRELLLDWKLGNHPGRAYRDLQPSWKGTSDGMGWTCSVRRSPPAPANAWVCGSRNPGRRRSGPLPKLGPVGPASG